LSILVWQWGELAMLSFVHSIAISPPLSFQLSAKKRSSMASISLSYLWKRGPSYSSRFVSLGWRLWWQPTLQRSYLSLSSPSLSIDPQSAAATLSCNTPWPQAPVAHARPLPALAPLSRSRAPSQTRQEGEGRYSLWNRAIRPSYIPNSPTGRVPRQGWP
jgi:hypothetical protein